MKKIFFFLLFLSAFFKAFSNPSDGEIVFGKVTISSSNNSLFINQESKNAIINWKDFSIKENEITNIFGNGVILNRVVSNMPSKIYGKLISNEKVYLINQNGILIDKNGVINSNGLLLSTLEIEDNNFLNSKDIFQGQDKTSQIVNKGKIYSDNGNIILISQEILNENLISSKNSNVYLIAAETVELINENEKNISVRKKGSGFISNTKNIEGVKAELLANNDNMYALAINHEGMINATGAKFENGKVILDSENAITCVKGKITAKNESTKQGGQVNILGKGIILDDEALIDTSSKKSAGTILIGGDFQGKNKKIKNAKSIFMGKEDNKKADPIEEGDGGDVILWADESNKFYGAISAKGGKIKGDGGFVEVSAKKNLVFKGDVTTNAFNGKLGTLLLDPSDITITTAATLPVLSGAASAMTLYDPGNAGLGVEPSAEAANNLLNDGDIQTALTNGNNVTITTTSGTLGTGDITILEDVSITWGTAATLKLQADRLIDVQSTIPIPTFTSTSTSNFDAVVFEANKTAGTAGTFVGIDIDDINITTSSGNVKMTGKSGNAAAASQIGIQMTAGNVTTTSGDIEFTGISRSTGLTDNHGIYILDTLSSTSGNITLTGVGGGTSSLNHGIYCTSATISTGGTIIMDGTSGAGALCGGVVTDSFSSISISGSNSLTITGNSIGIALIAIGISIIDSTITSTSSGDIIMTGIGNTGISAVGTNIQNSSTVTASGGGDVILTGSNKGTVSTNEGVRMLGAIGTIPSISVSNGGSITMDGKAGDSTFVATDSNCGILIDDSTVSLDGSGTITLTGESFGIGTTNYGISIFSSGPATGVFSNGTSISSPTTQGTITFTGTGGPGSTSNHGVFISPATSSIESKEGRITITGTGGTDGSGTSSTNHGVFLSAGKIESPITGSADIIVTGTGANALAGSNEGVRIESTGATITSINGDVTVTGTGGTIAGSDTNHGVHLITNSNKKINTTGTGDITVIGTSGTGASSIGVFVETGEIAADSTGDITIQTDTIDIDDTISGSANLTIKPKTASTNMTLAGAGGLSLDAASLGNLQNGFSLVTFGDTTNTATATLQAYALYQDNIKVIGDTITVSGATDTNGNDITFVSDNITVSAGVLSNSGTLNLQTKTNSRSISLLGGAGNYLLSSAELDLLNDNLSSVVIGNSSGLHEIVVGTSSSYTFNDFDLTLRGKNITINDALIMPIGRSISGSIGQNTAGTFNLNRRVTTSGARRFAITGVGTNNTLKGPNIDCDWLITSQNNGSLTVDPQGTADIANFINIQNLTGGSENDRFKFLSDGIDGNLIGGSDAPKNNILDYSDYPTLVLIFFQDGIASNIGGRFYQIQQIIGNVRIFNSFAEFQLFGKKLITDQLLGLNDIDRSQNYYNPYYLFYYGYLRPDLEKIINLNKKKGEIIIRNQK